MIVLIVVARGWTVDPRRTPKPRGFSLKVHDDVLDELQKSRKWIVKLNLVQLARDGRGDEESRHPDDRSDSIDRQCILSEKAQGTRCEVLWIFGHKSDLQQG